MTERLWSVKTKCYFALWSSVETQNTTEGTEILPWHNELALGWPASCEKTQTCSQLEQYKNQLYASTETSSVEKPWCLKRLCSKSSHKMVTESSQASQIFPRTSSRSVFWLLHGSSVQIENTSMSVKYIYLHLESALQKNKTKTRVTAKVGTNWAEAKVKILSTGVQQCTDLFIYQLND